MNRAQKAETHRNLKNYPDLIVGELPGISQKYRLNNFSTVRQIFSNSILIDSTQQAEYNKSIKILKILF
jgi:hypothetical protein